MKHEMNTLLYLSKNFKIIILFPSDWMPPQPHLDARGPFGRPRPPALHCEKMFPQIEYDFQ